jgi:integrase
MIVYKVKEQEIIDFSKRKPLKRKEILIVRSDDKNKSVSIPSSLTDFIYHYHSNNSLNTKQSSAYIICGFVNYLNKQVELGEDPCFSNLKLNGLYGLNHFHLAKYINHISNKSEKENSYETVKKKEDVLINFYDFLNSRKITIDDAKILKKIVPKANYKANSSRRGKYVLISPFEENHDITINYPTKDKRPSMILKDMNQDIWEQFIEYAEAYYPNIALGLAFQFMGGLRLGEVVNLTIDSAELHRNLKHIRLNIEDRQSELFRDRVINERKSQVKNPRVNQPVFDFNGRLFEIWDNHLKMINNLRAKKRSINSKSLFIDSEGQAMSGDTYESVFLSLKKDFLDFLGSRGNIYLVRELSQHKWGTHIGRHVFTNHLIKIGAVLTLEGKPNPEYLRILRGDRSVRSSAEYIDTKVIIMAVTSKLDLISEICTKI